MPPKYYYTSQVLPFQTETLCVNVHFHTIKFNLKKKSIFPHWQPNNGVRPNTSGQAVAAATLISLHRSTSSSLINPVPEAPATCKRRLTCFPTCALVTAIKTRGQAALRGTAGLARGAGEAALGAVLDQSYLGQGQVSPGHPNCALRFSAPRSLPAFSPQFCHSGPTTSKGRLVSQ